MSNHALWTEHYETCFGIKSSGVTLTMFRSKSGKWVWKTTGVVVLPQQELDADNAEQAKDAALESFCELLDEMQTCFDVMRGASVCDGADRRIKTRAEIRDEDAGELANQGLRHAARQARTPERACSQGRAPLSLL
jgi:hypothetical protein